MKPATRNDAGSWTLRRELRRRVKNPEATCLRCHGSGKMPDGADCFRCDGTGKVDGGTTMVPDGFEIVTVSLEVDLPMIAASLGHAAARNSTGVSRYMGGRLVARVLRRERHGEGAA